MKHSTVFQSSNGTEQTKKDLYRKRMQLLWLKICATFEDKTMTKVFITLALLGTDAAYRFAGT